MYQHAKRWALMLAVAMTACGEHDATGPDDSTPDLLPEGGPITGSVADLGNEAIAATSRKPRSFFVNPTSGSDKNTGTQAKPFKTLAKGLSIAISGDTMRLAAGTYSAATNGEKFTTSLRQITVPAGVKILGASTSPFSILKGAPGDVAGLNLLGSATVTNLRVTGFSIALFASQGTQSLKNLALEQNNVGLSLTGSANTTLTTGNVLLQPGGTAFGADVGQTAQLTLVGGAISAGGPNCGTGPRGVVLRQSARLTMKSGASITNVMGTAIEVRNQAKVTLTGAAKIQRDFTGFAGCAPNGNVSGFDATTLTLRNAQIVHTNGGQNGFGIFWASSGFVTLDTATIKGQSYAGLYSPGNLLLAASNATFQFNLYGIKVDGASPHLAIVKSTISNNTVGVHGAGITLRRTLVTSNKQVGILVTSSLGTDLGLANDPGVNLIAANGITGVGFDVKVTGFGSISAVGNSWTPQIQGADGSGHYATQAVTGTSTNPSAAGKNFMLPTTPDFTITL